MHSGIPKSRGTWHIVTSQREHKQSGSVTAPHQGQDEIASTIPFVWFHRCDEMFEHVVAIVRLLTSHIALSVCAMDDDVASKFMGGNSTWSTITGCGSRTFHMCCTLAVDTAAVSSSEIKLIESRLSI